MHHRSLSIPLVIGLSLPLLAGCGSGGGGGGTVADDSPGPTDSLNPTPTPVPTPTPTPTPTTPTPTPTPTAEGLAVLYGYLNLRYSFTGSANIYEDSILLEASGVETSGSNSLLVADQPSPYVFFACSHLDQSLYFCQGYFDQDALDMFLFTLDSNRSGSGNYLYCDSEFQELESCVPDLFEDPDGSLIASVTGSPVFTKAVSDDVEIVRTDSRHYKFVDKQARATDTIGTARSAGTSAAARRAADLVGSTAARLER